MSLILGSIPFAPYFFYKKIIDEGYQSRLVSISVKKRVIKGKEIKLTKFEQNVLESNKDKWKRFHLKNFILPFPVYHPVYNLIPVVMKRKLSREPGAKFVNNKGIFFGQFFSGEKISLNRPFKNQKLYNLPIFKNLSFKNF